VIRQRGVALALAASLLATGPAAVADPRIDYVLHCQGCHLPDGSGQPGAVPNLRGELGRFLTVPGGREYLVRVPGTAQAELSDARVAALLDWMLAEFSPSAVPEGSSPYSADEVARLRRRPLLDADETRRELMRAIRSLEQPSLTPIRSEGPPSGPAPQE
jgi:mono/diheme cytochrome c family protein